MKGDSGDDNNAHLKLHDGKKTEDRRNTDKQSRSRKKKRTGSPVVSGRSRSGSNSSARSSLHDPGNRVSLGPDSQKDTIYFILKLLYLSCKSYFFNVFFSKIHCNFVLQP